MSERDDYTGYMEQKNAAEIAEYARQIDDMMDDPAVRSLVARMPWITDKLAVMRAYMGDIKHFLEYETSGGKVGKSPFTRGRR